MDRDQLRLGDLIAFQIDEVEGFTAPNRDRWGVIKVLHFGEGTSVTVSVLEGLHDSCPGPDCVRSLKVLRPKRFTNFPESVQDSEPLVFATPIDGDLTLKSARIIGRERLHRVTELKAMANVKLQGHPGRIANIDWAALSLDHEDRAIRDLDTWKSEVESYSERQQNMRQEIEERQRNRLKGITLGVLRSETLFTRWDDRTQIVPEKFTNSVRAQANILLNDLAALGVRPRRPAAREIVRGFVEWLNENDGKLGYKIETEEREDIMQFLEEVCWAIKQKSLLDEVDILRSW